MSHECPATGCTRNVPAHMLMCRDHWWMVPKPLQRAVWNAYQDCPGTAAHRAAMSAAIEAVNRKLG